MDSIDHILNRILSNLKSSDYKPHDDNVYQVEKSVVPVFPSFDTERGALSHAIRIARLRAGDVVIVETTDGAKMVGIFCKMLNNTPDALCLIYNKESEELHSCTCPITCITFPAPHTIAGDTITQ